MQVILLERVEKLGLMGQTVDVATGYARNFLLPQKKALRATQENIAYFKAQKSQLEAQNIKRREEAEYAAKKLEGVTVTLIRQASEMGHLYGSVRSKDIVEGLASQNISMGRNQIKIPEPVKVLGVHTVHLVLHPEVHVDIRVNVAQSEEEAQVQLGLGDDSED